MGLAHSDEGKEGGLFDLRVIVEAPAPCETVLTVRSSDIISSVKAKLHAVYSLPYPHDQHLAYRSTLLDDDRSLSSYGIREGSKISLRRQASQHCDHCLGGDGLCRCSAGCPLHVVSKCWKNQHCKHCRGEVGACACDSCTRPSEAMCWASARCTHCAGGEGPCVCDVCARPKSALCYTIPWKHCKHCLGKRGQCACVFSCRRHSSSRCLMTPPQNSRDSIEQLRVLDSDNKILPVTHRDQKND